MYTIKILKYSRKYKTDNENNFLLHTCQDPGLVYYASLEPILIFSNTEAVYKLRGQTRALAVP